MRIAVFGAGAIGIFYAARLIEAGQDVTVIARGDALRALPTQGLCIDGPDGAIRIASAAATDDPTRVGPVDLVIVAVKAWQVSEIANSLEPMIGADTAVLPLQNGVEAAEQIAAAVGAEHVLEGLTKVIVRSVGPGVVEDIGFPPYIAAGELQATTPHRLDGIQAVFESAGITFDKPADIKAAVWEKFIFIVSVSGIGAVTRSEIGTLRTLPETRTLLHEAMLETYRVGRAQGVGLRRSIVDDTMGFVDQLPEGSTASLQRDIMAGRPSELESQVGAVVRFGKRLGIDTPVNRIVYSALLPMELAARKT